MVVLLVGAVLSIGVGTALHPGASPAHWQPWFAPDKAPVRAVLAIVAIAPWLYVGFDTLPQAAEEFAFSPSRTLRLMVLSIGLGALMYVTVLLGTGVVMPWQELVAADPAWATGSAVRASLGSAGVTLLGVAVCMGIFTGINGFFLASSRLLFSIGRARILPAWFRRLHPEHGTPSNAILFTAVLALVAPWFGRQAIIWIVDMAAVGTAFGYLYTCIAAWALLRERPALDGGAGRVVAALGAVLSAGFIVLLCVPGMPGFMAPPSWIAFAGWVASGSCSTSFGDPSMAA